MPQAPRASTPTEVLAGLVDRVTFHSAENGFCVLRVKARGAPVQRSLDTGVIVRKTAALYRVGISTVQRIKTQVSG
jgi:hypothetical protein